MKNRDNLIVLIQLLTLGYLVITEPLEIARPPVLLLYAAGAALGLWAVWAMRSSKFRVAPAVAPGAQLVMHGPYRFIRHPMYTALIILSVGALVHYATLDRIIAVAILWADLLAKISREEQHLQAAFRNYRDYAAKTKKLLPFVY